MSVTANASPSLYVSGTSYRLFQYELARNHRLPKRRTMYCERQASRNVAMNQIELNADVRNALGED